MKKGGGIVAETKKEERVIVQCVDAFKDSEREPLNCSTNAFIGYTTRAKQLIEVGVCIEMKK